MNSANPLRPLILLGPTTVGKTDVVVQLAERSGTEVINADKFYLYGVMPTVTGSSDMGRHTAKTHLYGVQAVDEPRWSDTRYATELRSCLTEIQGRGSSFIVEGCSHSFIRTAISTVETHSSQAPLLVGLRWKRGTDLVANCEDRAAAMLAAGMLDEYRAALENGWEEHYAVRKCFARTALNRHLATSTGLSRCRIEIAESLERHARRHYAQLSRIPNVVWIEHDRSHPDNTVRQILQRWASTESVGAEQI